jgi:hypothetical protein
MLTYGSISHMELESVEDKNSLPKELILFMGRHE